MESQERETGEWSKREAEGDMPLPRVSSHLYFPVLVYTMCACDLALGDLFARPETPSS